MATDSHRQSTRRSNLAALFKDPQVGGPSELARLLGKPKMKAHLSNIKGGARGMGDELAADIERALGKPEGWMDGQHPTTGEPRPSYGVAQTASHRIDSDDLPIVTWEELMKSTKVPDLFRTTLPDDALAPDFPRGTEVVWTTRRKTAPGRALLIRDAHGQLHARICHQGRAPGQWLATATHPGFLTFDSSEPGLTVVAVYKGRLEPDDV